MTYKKLALTTLSATLLATTAAMPTTISVLWTAGNTNYNANIEELAVEASSHDPAGDGGLDWDLTLWDPADATPDFTSYDVLVIGSVDFGLGVSAAGVLASEAAITAARGSRTMLTGQDADWHDLNNRPDQTDGPAGFMINSVNWAASGTGLGVVSFAANFRDSTWWTDADSFLSDEINASDVVFRPDDSVYLGADQGDFAVNEGLTDAGISSWGTSSHLEFEDIAGYEAINFTDADSAGRAITIVTSGTAGGSTGGGDDPDGGTTVPVVPLPGAAWFLIAGLGGFAGLKRRAANKPA